MLMTGQVDIQRRTIGSATRRLTLACALMVAVGSCTATAPYVPDAPDFDIVRGADVFTAGYEGIADIYVEPVSTASIAFAGLDGIANLDPKIAFIQRGDSLIVTKDGSPFAKFTLPDPDNVQGWAKLTSAAIQAARTRSQTIAEATSDTVYDAVFDKVTAKLDRYSRYHNTAETRSAEASRNGYSGIGVTIADQNGGVVVSSVFQGSPAEESGIHAGDRIVGAKGQSTDGMSMREVATLLRGPNGSSVVIDIDRGGVEKSFAVVRRRVIEQTVSYTAIDDIAYFRISGFNRDTANALTDAIEAAKSDLGDDLPGLVLDLRQNRGGNLDEAVDLADLFVDDGPLLETRGRHPQSIQHYQADLGETVTLAPMAVLIDSGSASAAEVVAAALQDSGRALVIGARSYGKGTVQRVVKLPNRSELILTWARMHAPSGYALSGFGVFPSICTPDYGDNPSRSATALREGRLNPSEALRRRMAADSAGPLEKSALNRWCQADHPPSTDDGDTRLAVELLSDRRLFQHAFHASRVALGERPKTE